ncbi:MAG: hypothetical protein E7013_05005 [Alphaproteobacteria bacterium]|nr:hypothetical protein [Alphaproteobacteria bacterium]
MTNYWQNKAQNKGKCSYWDLVDEKNLNMEEKIVCSFMRRSEQRYEYIMLPPLPRLHLERLKYILPRVRPNVLQALTNCCVLTYTFVPIKDITTGWKEIDLSYEQRHALWKGTGFKGLSAYAGKFIGSSLSQEKPVCKNLFDLHCQMNIKDFSLQKEYLSSIEAGLKEPEKTTLWNSSCPEARAFREQVFTAFPMLKEKLNAVQKISKKHSVDVQKRISLEKIREN